MVTKIKPVRIKQYNTPNPGNNLWYKDDTLFQWNTWWDGWDMYYNNFNWVTKTWSSFDLDLSSKYVPTWNFTVNAPSDIKEWQTYLLRVDNWATAYTMSLWNWITNLQWTDITLTPNAIDMFVFLATKDWDEPVKLELQKEMPQWWWWIYYFFLDNETDQTELDKLWDWYNTLPDDPDDFDNSVIMIDYWNGSWQYPTYSPTWRYYYKTQDSADMYFFWDNYKLKVQFQMQWWYTRIGVYSVTIEPLYIAWTWISISGNEISSTVGESNTKTFYLSSTSDLTTAQAAYDWYKDGKNPIVAFSWSWATYTVRLKNSNYLAFTDWTNWDWITSWSYSYVSDHTLYLNLSWDTVTSVSLSEAASRNTSIKYLDTHVNYWTPYTPQYPWSPATKKYVDDKVSVVSGDTGTTYTIKVAHSDPSWVANNVITFVTPLLEYSKLIALNNADAILRELNTDALWYFQKFLDEWLIGEQLGPGDTSEETTIIYYYLMNSPEWDMRVVDGKGFIREDWAEVWNFIDYN